jgi:uncharacterized MAPEG superfamily protein
MDLEIYALMGAVLLGLVSAMYLAGRILFLPLYAAGIPWIRTFSWNAATLGLVLVGAQYVWAQFS